MKALQGLYQQSQESYINNPETIQAIYPDYPPEEVPDFAALVLVANALFNLDEVITRS
jgi:hypothetical protein